VCVCSTKWEGRTTKHATVWPVFIVAFTATVACTLTHAAHHTSTANTCRRSLTERGSNAGQHRSYRRYISSNYPGAAQ
jgi:hypothetical protein